MRTVSAIFEREQDARTAQEWLFSHGLAPGQVSLIDRTRPRLMKDESSSKARGLWANIKDMVAIPGAPESFEKRLLRGGYLVTASVPDDKLVGAMAILEKHGIFRFGDRPEAPPNDPAAETPDAVHERVLLRDYRSWIERPAPPKSGNKDGLDAVEELFRERVVEMPETEEQVAFETVARVREQIVIRKEARTRVQHVHATTRRSEVEIETLAQTSALKR